MDDVDLLSGVLDKTGALIAGVQPDQWARPTPCAEWDVRALVQHILGWMEVFDAGANGGAFDGLERARGTLKPDDRGPDTAMAEETEAPARAPAVDRLAAFMGRAVP